MKTTKKLLLGLSSLSLLGMSSSAKAAESVSNPSVELGSPLSANSKRSVSEVVQALKAASKGKVSAASVKDAIQVVLKTNPHISASVMASSITQLGLDKEGMKNAVVAMSTTYNISQSEVASVLITESYLNEGKSSANTLISNLKESLGNNVVEEALVINSNTAIQENTVSEDLHINSSSPYYG